MKKGMILSIILFNERDMKAFAYPFASSQETAGAAETAFALRSMSAERRA